MSNFNTKTKVVATVGPACSDKETLKAMLLAGVDVFRINFSHGAHEDKKEIIDMIHEINAELGTNTAILADLSGPKIRLGNIEGDSIELEPGDEIIFTSEPVPGNADIIQITYPGFAKDVRAGHRVMLDDGKIEMRVKKVLNDKEVLMESVYSGTVRPQKGVNLPETILSIPSITDKDMNDLQFIFTQNLSWIALSFVRAANDIIKLRGMIEFNNHPAKIIAKIEKPEAVEVLDEIIAASDGIMVARGDLGVEIPVENVPLVQKRIVKACIKESKPVIIATQMMESMMENAGPTRAEVTDVANAIFDGADAVMLSGETAVGKHPVRVVETMQRICAQAESDEGIYNIKHTLDKQHDKFLSDAVIFNATFIADGVDARAIVGMTKTGYTAFKLSSCRPKAKIYVFTENTILLNQLSLLWGVRAFHYAKFESNDGTIRDVVNMLRNKSLLEQGDRVISTGSMPIAERGPTNFVKLTVVD